jgi:hypothetical protein
MAPLPITFELSTHNVATLHNLHKSPLLRLPAELREKIWALCLSNVQVRISARVGDGRNDDLIVDWDSLGRLGFGFDCTFWSMERSDKRGANVPADGLVNIWYQASYDLTFADPDIFDRTADFPSRLPQLWRLCKLVYNETYDLPFAAGNTFHFQDLATFMLHHKYDPHSMRRIKSLLLSTYLESGLFELLCNHIEEDLDDAEFDLQLKDNLQRALPALEDVRIESRISSRTRAATEDPSLLQKYGAMWIQREKNRVRSIVRWWEPLVSRVVVEEA